jgi:ketosteroid isomerase-like protein
MRFLLLRIMPLVLAGTSVAAQQAAKSQEPSITLPPSLARVLTDYETGWKAGDALGLAQLFTEDGLVLSPGQPPVKGRVAIQKLYTGPGSPLSLRAFAYAINGDVAYIVGGYSSASGVPDEGKFTLTLRKRNRRWLIASDMDNENRRR